MQTNITEKRYFVRTMIVGKESAGKTSLLRRLLKEDISNVTSTDGVDIVVRRVKINTEDGKWIIGKEMNDDNMSRLKRALISNAENTQNMPDDTKNRKIDQHSWTSSLNEGITTHSNTSPDKTEDTSEISTLLMPGEDFKIETNSNSDKHKERNRPSSFSMHEDDFKTNPNSNSSSLVMPEDLMSCVYSSSTVNTPSNRFALCELWDFAGHKEFYATHQAFLTSCAVYLVVADMTDDISKPGLSQCFGDFPHIGEYVNFWLDSIYCHRTSDEEPRHGYFDPPIVLVFTGKDKYEEENLTKRKRELNDQIEQVFELQSKHHHFHQKFYLSNTKDSDEEFKKLRYAIYEAARRMANWGKAFPLKWILLEYLIEINRNNGINFINFTDMCKLAKHPDINIQQEEELLLFLQFQHNVGHIIFFEHIREFIILRPQWLADAFRCLVSDRIDNSPLHHLMDWKLFMQQGKISEVLITKLFESKDAESQFLGQKKSLYEVMEKLDILVKIENSCYYIMPSMMPSTTFDEFCKQNSVLTEKCKRTSWLCFKFEFLPPSFFNHLYAWFIRNYRPSKVDGGIALYHGICMFDIDSSDCSKILVTMSTDTISLQVVSFSQQRQGLQDTCSDLYSAVTQLIERIKMRYKVKISFKIHFKCRDGYYFQNTFEYKNLKSVEKCFCPEHEQTHQSEQIYSPWMNREVKRISVRAKINSRLDNQNPESIPNKEKAFAQDHSSVKTNLPDSVTLSQKFNIKEPGDEERTTYSCIKTGDTIVFTKDRRLIICNSEGTDIHEIPLSYTPYYITVVNSNTVAVTCTGIRTILIINISTCSIKSTINTSDICLGISYNDNNMYVVIGGCNIHVMDQTGKVIRNMPLPSNGIRDITVDRNRLVCIDKTSIYCCSLDGKIIWNFKQDEDSDLHNVTTDDKGNVYATDYNCNTVVVVSDDGENHRKLLTESDGLENPGAIYFDKKENVLLVCIDGGETFFFII